MDMISNKLILKNYFVVISIYHPESYYFHGVSLFTFWISATLPHIYLFFPVLPGNENVDQG